MNSQDMLKTEIARVEAEEVFYRGSANLFRGIEGIGGRLLVTSTRLLFQPHAVNIQRQSLELPISAIKGASRRNTMGIVPNGMKVNTRDGLEYQFVVKNRDAIIECINGLVAKGGNAAPPVTGMTAPVLEYAEGTVAQYDYSSQTGTITSPDGRLFTFELKDWIDTRTALAGQRVRFIPCGQRASQIMLYGEAAGNPMSKSRIVYILFGLCLGTLGIHNFYAGYTGRGIAQLLLTLLTCGVLSIPIWIWAIIEVITVTKDAAGVDFSQ